MTGRNHTRVCEVCGEAYIPRLTKAGVPRRAKHSVCSQLCRWKKQNRARPSRSKAAPSATCITCGSKYKPSSANNTHFCSRSCRGYWHNHNQKYKDGPVYKSLPVSVLAPIIFAPCAVCGEYNEAPRKTKIHLCEIHEKSIARHNIENLFSGTFERECSECGVGFCNLPGRGGNRTCSESCLNAREKKRKRKEKARRRAIERKVESENIDPIAVFERDKWKCHICGKLTLKSKRGTSHDRAPELEHIVSLADGGTHTWSNVACSCRKCNGDKGAASFGQINLGFSL